MKIAENHTKFTMHKFTGFTFKHIHLMYMSLQTVLSRSQCIHRSSFVHYANDEAQFWRMSLHCFCPTFWNNLVNLPHELETTKCTATLKRLIESFNLNGHIILNDIAMRIQYVDPSVDGVSHL